MTVALRRSVIGTTYLFDYCVSSGFDRYGHTKSDSESDKVWKFSMWALCTAFMYRESFLQLHAYGTIEMQVHAFH